MTRDYWDPQEFDARARRLYEDGAHEEALDLLREAIGVHPESVDLRVSLGYTWLAVEEYGFARRSFRRALELQEDHEEALVGLGDALLKLGERARAFLVFDRVMELGFDEDADLLLAMARALYREGLYERALDFYRRAVGRGEAEAELGYTLYQLGRQDAAIRWLGSALDRAPRLHEARVFLGNLCYERGDYEEALREFEVVPPEAFWDPLAVWRTVELLRGYRSVEPDDPALEPYLDQLDVLGRDPTPEERLLSEIEASADGSAAPYVRSEAGQLDLFGLGIPVPEEREAQVHTVRARDGSVYRGDWLSIVRALRDDSPDPSVSVTQYMRDTARRVLSMTGVRVPDDDPEGFVRASERAGLLRIVD